MVNALILGYGLLVVASIIVFLAWLGDRQHRNRERHHVKPS
jgi:hypothetical protein